MFRVCLTSIHTGYMAYIPGLFTTLEDARRFIRDWDNNPDITYSIEPYATTADDGAFAANRPS